MKKFFWKNVEIVLCILVACVSFLHATNLSLYHHPIKNDFPDEMSFCIADLKFDGNSVKICEFGEGLESEFKGYDALHGTGAVWAMFWEFITAFNLPVWYTDKPRGNKRNRAIKRFINLGGMCVSNLQSLPAHDYFQKMVERYQGAPKMTSYAGIVVARTVGLGPSALNNFKTKYPQFLMLGDATNEFVRSKKCTCDLFDNETLMNFKPRFKICEKKYSSTLAQSIINELGCDIFVIKPTNATLGYGVIMTNRNDLDKTLQLILKHPKQLGQQYKNDAAYFHWAKDHAPKFIVEAYAPSKIVLMNNKPYDPTMRVIFALHNCDGCMNIYFFDAYWKFPAKSLTDNASLTEKHKSCIKRGTACSAMVDAKDFEQVTVLMSRVLPELYNKMLVYRTQN